MLRNGRLYAVQLQALRSRIAAQACRVQAIHTSKSRLAVDREFMYIGSAGPGRADGRKARRADGRADGGRADGRADGRTSGRADGRAQQYNDVHRF